MARLIHIATARTMLNSGAPVDISVWKYDGFVLELCNVTSRRYSFMTTGGKDTFVQRMPEDSLLLNYPRQ